MLTLFTIGGVVAAGGYSAPQRLADAVAIAVGHLNTSSFTELACPKEQQVGMRPKMHTSARMGTMCEPWVTRGVQMVLDYFLAPSMVGLEWSAGSGSIWTLRRLAHLHTVEHNTYWAQFVKEVVRKQLPQLMPKWSLIVRPCEDLTPGACAGLGDYQADDASTNYSRYVRAPRVRFHDAFPFDYVLVDGMARDECLAEVMETKGRPMLADHGLLVLDNSERPYHASIPPHWPCISISTHVDETTLYMRCVAGWWVHVDIAHLSAHEEAGTTHHTGTPCARMLYKFAPHIHAQSSPRNACKQVCKLTPGARLMTVSVRKRERRSNGRRFGCRGR